MSFYIRIKDGVPFEHPLTEHNLKQAFPLVDINNLPSEFAKFERIPKPGPSAGKQIVSATCSYQWVDGVVKDIWEIVEEDAPEEPIEPQLDNEEPE
jgi:hypothetical protein